MMWGAILVIPFAGKRQAHKLEREAVRDPLEEVQEANAADVEVKSVRGDIILEGAAQR